MARKVSTVIDIFANAPIVEAKGKNKHRDLPGRPMALIRDLAEIRAVEALITPMRIYLETEIKKAASAMVVTAGMKSKTRPENWVATEGKASATIVFGKRSPLSVLTDEEIDLLDSQEISYDTETVGASFTINDDVLNDPKWRAKISAALNAIPGLPKHTIQRTQATKVSTVSEETVNQVFALTDAQAVRQLLPVVTTVAVRSKPEAVSDPSSLFARLGQTLGLVRPANRQKAA